MANNLTFSNFVWPNNPERYRVKFSREFEAVPAGNGLWNVSIGSRLARVYESEGFFYGAQAYDNFRTLSNYFINGTIDTLDHPQWETVEALMTELEVLEEPGDERLHYRAVFVEMPPV